nr:hypothetical protein [Tanacetum cinerariifolium]
MDPEKETALYKDSIAGNTRKTKDLWVHIVNHMHSTYPITKRWMHYIINGKWKTVRLNIDTFCGVYDNVFRMYANRANDEDYLQRTWQEVPEFIAQREEHKSKSYKSIVDSSFNTMESGEGGFNLNSTTRDEEDELREVRQTRPMGRDQAKRKGKARTSPTSQQLTLMWNRCPS